MHKSGTSEARVEIYDPSTGLLLGTIVVSIIALVAAIAYISDSNSTMTLHNVNVRETLSGYKKQVVKIGNGDSPGNVVNTKTVLGLEFDGDYFIKENQSSTLFVFNYAYGVSVHLPKAKAGLNYDFAVGTSLHTGTGLNDGYHLVTTHGNSIMGSFMMGPGDKIINDSEPGGCIAYVGTSVANTIHMDGNRKGGAVGTKFSVKCLDDRFWVVKGHLNIDHDDPAPEGHPESPFQIVL